MGRQPLSSMLVGMLLVCALASSCNVGACSAGMFGGNAASAIPAPPDVAAPPPDAAKTPSGLSSKVLTPGHGTRHPRPNSRVTVHYTGWTTDGKMFDSSVARGQPASFGLDEVISGWTEGVQMMVEGEKRRFWIPEDLAYGGRPGSPQGMLVFDVELIRIDS
jgi:FKBP-type peptidyl-prolyl cis-trans isomerase